MWKHTFEGPIWESLPGAWYMLPSGHILCADCAASYAEDNGQFEFLGYHLGYQQVAGFMDYCEPLYGDTCMQCEKRAHGPGAGDSATALARQDDAP